MCGLSEKKNAALQVSQIIPELCALSGMPSGMSGLTQLRKPGALWNVSKRGRGKEIEKEREKAQSFWFNIFNFTN